MSLPNSPIGRKETYLARMAGESVDVPPYPIGREEEYLAAISDSVAPIYSETEVATGSTWIDGKPIYRKVVDLGSLPNAAKKNVAHGIENISDVITLKGIAKSSIANFTIPLVWDTLEENIGIYINGSNVVVCTNKNRSSYSGVAIIEYTKTTD